MNTPKKSINEEVPEFLLRQPEQKDSTALKKAYCKYLRDHRLTPEDASAKKISIKLLLAYLQEYDSNWVGIPP